MGTYDTFPNDYQRVAIVNPISGTSLITPDLVYTDSNANTWQLVTANLTPFLGQTVGLKFQVHETKQTRQRGCTWMT